MKLHLAFAMLLLSLFSTFSANAQLNYYSPATKTLALNEVGYFEYPECMQTIWQFAGPVYSDDNGLTWKEALPAGIVTGEAVPTTPGMSVFTIKGTKNLGTVIIRYNLECAERYDFSIERDSDGNGTMYWRYVTVTIGTVTAKPTITSTDASGISSTSATLGGNVSADGGASVTERGIVWASTADPTIANNKVSIGTGTGTFSQAVSGFSPGATIHYRAFATNSEGTSYGADKTFTTHAVLSASISASTNVTCYGSGTGSATVTATGGAGTYTYAWSPSGGSGATASNLIAGTYVVTVSDNVSTATASVAITQPSQALSATISAQTNVSSSGGNNGSATVTAAGGTSPYTYQWSPGGGVNTTVSDLVAGTYTVSVTDQNNCTRTASVTITQPVQSYWPSYTKTLAANEVGYMEIPQCSLTIWKTGGPEYSDDNGLTWKPTTGLGVTLQEVATPTPSPGFWTLSIVGTKNIGTVIFRLYYECTETFDITQPFDSFMPEYWLNITATIGSSITKPTVTSADATGISSSSATLGGNVSTDGGASVTDRGIVWASTADPTIANNKVSIGTGTGTFSQAVSGFSSGATIHYRAFATNSEGTSYGADKTFTTQTVLSASISASTNVACYGSGTGSATVTATGGAGSYTYAWSPSGGSGATASNLIAGTYVVTVSDNVSTATASVAITQPSQALSATISAQTNVSSSGGNDGSATVSATGGTSPYTYLWSPSGGANTVAANLTVGTYTVTVTDINSCTATATVSITQPGPLTATISASTNVACYGSGTGSATVTAAGGAGSYTYAWSPSGGSGATASNLIAGTYLVTVSDNVSTATASVAITQPAQALSASISAQTNVSTSGGNNGSATVSATGGTSPYVYVWSPSGGANTVAANLTAGTYTVTVTDNKSCTATATVNITQPIPLSATISSSTNVDCYGANTGSATVTAAGGGGSYTYLWSPGEGTGATVSNLIAGTYIVTVSDNVSSVTASVAITQAEYPLALTISQQSNPACSNGTITLIASGGKSPYTYAWSPSGGTSATATNLASGTYTVNLTDNNNCHTSISFDVFRIPDAPTLAFIGNGEICGEERTTIAANGCTGKVKWSNGYVGHYLNAPVGTFTATCTINDCESPASLPITVSLRGDCNTITISPVNVTLCPGKTVTLTASGCIGNISWSTGTSGTSITVGTTGQYIAICSSGGVAAAMVKAYTSNLTIGINVVLGMETIKALETITANNYVGTSIYAKPSVYYQAGKSLTFLPGFQVSKGSVFEAKIGTCPN